MAALASGYHRQLARWYAKQGVRVFPCRPEKKSPFISNWNEKATADLAQIERWWKQYPQAIIGLPCGPNSLFVVDVDCHEGGENGFTESRV